MSKTASPRKGAEGFEGYFSAHWGDRWPGLKSALIQPVRHFTLEDNLRQPYFLDEASLRAARALGVLPGDKVLDMCAAPGGKSLVLLGALGDRGELTCNEYSRTRKARLINVMEDYPQIPTGPAVKITGYDATKWYRYEKASYDKILLDAPCSSERHVLESPKHLALWSPSRIKRLAAQQFSLLACALEVVKPGGEILYCTCALSAQENDGVVGRLVRKRPGQLEIRRAQDSWGEETEYGRLILPDRHPGSGPIYYSLLRKIAGTPD